MNQTHFGFKTVSTEEKKSLVRDVFNSVASRYDVMNDAMSMGVHRLWKRRFIAGIDIRPHQRFLDVAGGTGDIAFALHARGADEIVVCDINHAMLHEGQKRADDRAQLDGLEWVCGNAESLPLPSNHFHHYTIAFGIRNVTDIEAALREAYRVLLPGGRFYCLEFSHVTLPPMKSLYDAYSFHVIPTLGKMIAGDAAPYQYLVESIRQFPTQDIFQKMIADAEFKLASYKNLSGGVVAIHSGVKI